MTLRVIGAGLPRTGTSSLREALRHLLGAPVYHMSEAFAHPEHVATWTAAIQGTPPEWDRFLAGYAAGVDTPFSACWRDLAAAYPEAPVLLSHRGSAEVWFRSMVPTVLTRIHEVLSADQDDPMTELFRVFLSDVVDDLDDLDDVRAAHDRRLDQVRSAIPPDRLVEWQPGDGWEPLCRALDVPVPDLPFPHENSTADFLARRAARAQESAR